MTKKLWNCLFSVLLSVILLLLVGIVMNLDRGNNKTSDLPVEPVIGLKEETVTEDHLCQDNDSSPFLYELFSKDDEEIQLLDQFIKGREREQLAKPKVAIIIDDLGYQTEIAERILDLNYPVAISVLPFLPHSQLITRMALEENETVLLHMPMEPHNPDVNPGEGAIFSTMNEEEIRNKLKSVFQDLPDVQGMNNHMGSKLTENREIMEIILSVIRDKGLFFVDSLTSPDSVGYQLSKEMGIKTAHRSVFLDNEQEPDYIRNQVDYLKELALKNGSAIAIGHPYCHTIDILVEAELTLQAEGIEIVRLEELLE